MGGGVGGGVGGVGSLSWWFSPQANKDRVAAVLSVSGGQIGVFEASVHEYTNLCVTKTCEHVLPFLPLFQLSKPGRLDTDNVPTLQNTANIMDFAFDPFNNNRLVVGKSFNIL